MSVKGKRKMNQLMETFLRGRRRRRRGVDGLKAQASGPVRSERCLKR